MTFDLTINTQVKLPVVVAKNFTPIPSSEIRGEFTRSGDIKSLKKAELFQNYCVLMMPQVADIKAEVNDGHYTRAVIAKIILNSAIANSVNRVKFEVIMRCDITELDYTADCLMATVDTVPSFVSNNEEALATISLIKKETIVTKELSPEDQLLSQKIALVLNRNLSLDVVSDSLANIAVSKMSERLKYLFELDATKRLLLVLTDLRSVKFHNELERKIDENVRRNMSEQQKEYYLREKMRAIQEELGDKAKKDSDVEKLRDQIKKAGLPKSMEEKALNEVNRFAMTPSTSPESGIIKTYLDFVLSLPWSTSSEDTNDLSLAKRILDEDHYGLDKVKDRILEYLAVRLMTNENPQTILCLAGPPGVGKTSLAKSVARALNKKFIKQSLGGVRDEAEIRGHRRTYLGALPGRILQSMAKAKTNNPVFLLDEIDKMSSDYKGDPTSAMLEVLDPEQNRYFSDNYLEEPFDLSKCFFIATANYLGNIPAPLRDRLEIVELSSYTEYEKFEIARRHLIEKQIKLNGLETNQLEITDQTIYHIIQMYTREAGVRELERLIGKIVRKSVTKILIEKESKVVVTVDNLEEFLGKVRFETSDNTGKDLVGVVTGLAYTEFGGDTLQIEVAHYKGNGRVHLTGKLGEVMKESAETALSYVKANADDFGIDYKLFEESDLHIHVPEGATPKDGPSAGVTMVCAIVSSFTNLPVHHLTGMTGEITLRGRVLPIGGLREKSIAAHRAGLKRILIPKENLKDIEEIPESVRNSLEIITIEDAKEAVSYVLIK
ncbi:MAG: endopeptidase La [Erysipelotrichaceae bacterium]|nr:endopeptidase La [Erysipelotrichaceae bacterium]